MPPAAPASKNRTAAKSIRLPRKGRSTPSAT
jgi:hypothetical protein